MQNAKLDRKRAYLYVPATAHRQKTGTDVRVPEPTEKI